MAAVGAILRFCRPPAKSSALTPSHPKRCHVEAHALRCVQGCRLTGVGSSVPETVLTNFDLEKIVDTSDEWITQRTGIRKRRVLGKGEKLADHAAKAALNAMEMSEIKAVDVDCVLFATSSADDIFGSACQVQHAIDAHNAAAFDVTSACSGFVVALITAAQYIRSGTFKNIVIVGGDALSRFVDWRDRTTCILFGDGCGAVMMTAGKEGHSCSLMGMSMQSDGGGYAHLNAAFENSHEIKAKAEESIAAGRSKYCNIAMNGQEVYKWAVRGVPQIIDKALKSGDLQQDVIDWLVMHQANQRILDATAKRLAIAPERAISNLASYGNTSAGSIPIALDEAVRNGNIKSGDVLALAGFGAGLTMAAAIVRWG